MQQGRPCTKIAHYILWLIKKYEMVTTNIRIRIMFCPYPGKIVKNCSLVGTRVRGAIISSIKNIVTQGIIANFRDYGCSMVMYAITILHNHILVQHRLSLQYLKYCNCSVQRCSGANHNAPLALPEWHCQNHDAVQMQR